MKKGKKNRSGCKFGKQQRDCDLIRTRAGLAFLLGFAYSHWITDSPSPATAKRHIVAKWNTNLDLATRRECGNVQCEIFIWDKEEEEDTLKSGFGRFEAEIAEFSGWNGGFRIGFIIFKDLSVCLLFLISEIHFNCETSEKL